MDVARQGTINSYETTTDSEYCSREWRIKGENIVQLTFWNHKSETYPYMALLTIYMV
jgi:hypothetical protein